MKTIIKSLLMIVAAAAIVGGVTYASYHKEGKVLGATFSNNDQMDLKIDQNPSGGTYDWVNEFAVPTGNHLTNTRPGSTGQQILDIKNVGNVDAEATIKMTARADTGLYRAINFEVLFDANHDGGFETKVASGPMTAWNSNTYKLGKITSGVTTEGNFSGKIASVKIIWSVPAEAGNEVMGSNVVIDTVFGLNSI